MQPIHRLNTELCIKISSQIAITSISDVVRALMHNSVDAGASNISIKIDLESLSVCLEDDGSGISLSDMEFVGKLNYTSKEFVSRKPRTRFRETSGLPSSTCGEISGFKGEALSSITHSSSKVAIVSAVGNSVTSKIIGHETSPSLVNLLLEFFNVKIPARGSIVIVSRLFHNMPVRRRIQHDSLRKNLFLVEVKKIIFEIMAYRPFASVNTMFLKSGTFQSVLSIKYQYGIEKLYSSLFNVVLSSTQNIKTSKDEKNVLEGFYNISLDYAFSVGFIFVNKKLMRVPPQKYEIIRSIIGTAHKLQNRLHKKLVGGHINFCLNFQLCESIAPSFERAESSFWSVILRLLKSSMGINKKQEEAKFVKPKNANLIWTKGNFISRRDDKFAHADFFSMNQSELLRGECEVIAQIDRLFILVTIGGRLFALDQHACDERITVEKLFKKHMEKTESSDCDLRVRCINPIVISSTLDEISKISKAHDTLCALGIDFRVSKNSLTFTHLPRELHLRQDLDSLKLHLLQHANRTGSIAGTQSQAIHPKWILHMKFIPDILSAAIIDRACRLSIKFGQILTREEMSYLVTILGTCFLPFQCAHGRPTIVLMGNILEFGNFTDDYQL